MAKALFNSPRYDKKIITNEASFTVYMGLSIIGIGALLSIIFFNPAIVICSIGIAFYGFPFYVQCYSEKRFVYKPYIKTLEKQKKLFHVEGKSSYQATYEQIKSNHFHLDLTLRLLAVVMNADKEERVVEMQCVKDYLQNLLFSNSSFSDLQQYSTKITEFKSYLKDNYSVEDVAFAMYWWFEEKESIEDRRHETLYAMFSVAYADGDFCENEEYMLRYIAYHMRLTNNDYENVLFKFLRNNNDDDNFKERVEDYIKTRYKRDGGYWYRDRFGNKQWHSIPKDEDDEANEESKESENAPHIPTELEKAYAVLGIPVDATPSEINACKRNLMRRNHPDLVAYKGQEAVAAATSKCQAINQAYELLKANGRC